MDGRLWDYEKRYFSKYVKRNNTPFKRVLLGLLLIFFTISTIVPTYTYSFYQEEINTKESIMNQNDTGVILLDRKGRPFFTFYEVKNRKFVPLSEIPKVVQQAAVASEDKDFYQHDGFSVRAIARSAVADLKEGEFAYGGSTITQQLVKNSLLTPKKSLTRKYQEIILSRQVEERFTKDEILEMYLNSVYFGEGAFGIENAAQVYFNKSAKELTLPEAAILIGILPSPSAFSPVSGDLEAAIVKQKQVLTKMREQHYITRDQLNQAIQTNLTFSTNRDDDLNKTAPHFALMVRDELIEKFGEEEIARSGFKVKTTLDLDWQITAEQEVKNQVSKLHKNKVSNGAAVVIDVKTGEVRALVGSKNWHDEKDGKVNLAVWVRQPGSSFKPIVYLAAFEKGLITPSTILQDRETTFQGNYSPKNYDLKFRGPVTVRRALSNSLNVPSVEVMSKVGLPETMEMADRLGISTIKDPSQYGLSLVLGTGQVKLVELTNAYATIANQGAKNNPTTILEIIDKKNRTIYTYTPEPTQVIAPEYPYLITSILTDKNSRREIFGNTLDMDILAAVKTGTTENYKDSLTLGYTPNLAVGVWVGNNDERPMDRVAGSLGAAPIFKSLIQKFSEGNIATEFPKPERIVALTICGASEYFIEDKKPASASCAPPKQVSAPSKSIPLVINKN